MSKKTFTGKVISLSGQNTVRVAVITSRRHPTYLKTVRWTDNYLVHTTTKLALGDEVVIEECRPVSKSKKFMVKSVKGEEK